MEFRRALTRQINLYTKKTTTRYKRIVVVKNNI
nr:MAG TPA: hypothetical protein [Caudoviricetes sp.]